jgi:hypothetical protein
MDNGPIPFTSIVEYFRIYRIGEFEDFLYIMRLLDNSILEWSREKNKPSGNDSAKVNGNKSN